MIIAAILVGPGEALRYLDRTLRLAFEWADDVVAYADGAGQEELDALEYAGATVQIAPEPQFRNRESDSRNGLIFAVDARMDYTSPETTIVVVIDCDEELVTKDGSDVGEALERIARSEYNAWPVEFRHLWTSDGKHYRTDRAWAPSHGLRIYRWRRGLKVPDKELASQPIPYDSITPHCPGHESPFRMLHWGYARSDDRAAKAKFYREHDGGRFHAKAHIFSIDDGLHRLAPMEG